MISSIAEDDFDRKSGVTVHAKGKVGKNTRKVSHFFAKITTREPNKQKLNHNHYVKYGKHYAKYIDPPEIFEECTYVR